MAELVVALESLHAMRIVHRDVKPANILVDNYYHIVLADFGLARDFGFPQPELPWSAGPRDHPSPRPFGDMTEGWFGTTGYVAPEIYCDRHSYEVDIWSAGVVLYRLLSGEVRVSSFLTADHLSKHVLFSCLLVSRHSRRRLRSCRGQSCFRWSSATSRMRMQDACSER